MPTRDQFTDAESFLGALRDWFAGQALPVAFAIRSKGMRDADLERMFGNRIGIHDSEIVAALAYGFADALLTERLRSLSA